MNGRSSARRIVDRPEFRLAEIIAALGLMGILWSMVCTIPAIHWNPVRLAPSFALAYGKTIYPAPDSAEQLGWIYGPVFPVWYLPVTWTENPTIALALAGVWNAVTVIAPMLLVLHEAGVRRGRSFVVAAVLHGTLLAASAVFRKSFQFVHVDAVCVACGVIACVALHRVARGGHRGLLHLAAAAVALALWTKQIAVMLVPGLFLWLWSERRKDLLWPLFFWCVTGGVKYSHLGRG